VAQMTTTDLVAMHLRWPTIGFVGSAVQVALLAFVRLNGDDLRRYEPDPWTFEAPFVNPEWPRS
jgi:hypothetical protein